MLIQATLYVKPNEKAYSLQEIHLQSPDYAGFHRYRILIVNRDGNLAEYREDMGLASNFKGAKQINIPSFLEHSVAELIALADELRWDTDIDIKDWLQIDEMKLA